MTTLFFIFLILVVAHFILEGIIAPSERSKTRLDLFALRDEIRNAKIVHGAEFNDELYDHMQAHVNKSIYLLHNYNIVGLYRAYRNAKQNEDEVIRKMDHFYALLKLSKVPKLVELHVKILLYTCKGLALNSIGWLPYFMLPVILLAIGIFMLYLFMSKVFRKSKEYVGRLVVALLELPENLFNRFFPTMKITEV